MRLWGELKHDMTAEADSLQLDSVKQVAAKLVGPQVHGKCKRTYMVLSLIYVRRDACFQARQDITCSLFLRLLETFTVW